jgi:hypothetical protein
MIHTMHHFFGHWIKYSLQHWFKKFLSTNRNMANSSGGRDQTCNKNVPVHSFPSFFVDSFHGHNVLRISSKTGAKLVCHRACMLNPLVVRSFTPNKQWMESAAHFCRPQGVRQQRSSHLTVCQNQRVKSSFDLSGCYL